MLARIDSAALDGIQVLPVEVEVDLSRGLPALNVVGLPEGAVREAKDRIRAALGNSGFQVPARRITINLAPADLPKEGSAYDLPMAMGILVAMERLPEAALRGSILLGELSLDGRLKPIPGALPAALHARRAGVARLILPAANGPEAALVEGVEILAPETLLELCQHLAGEKLLLPHPVTPWASLLQQEENIVMDLKQVRGQEHAKRALEVVAAGGHNLIMTGPPGSGKTLMARCLPGILPPLTMDEALEATSIHSVAGKLPPDQPVVVIRPFRSPHHTASQVALVGGGGIPQPGEVSLAHRGILFLDEIPEFNRAALEVLREPLEGGMVTISRAARSTLFPASFQLVAACNPCPCGHLGDPRHACRCSALQVERYRARLSGPLLDRIDLHVEVPPVPYEKLVDLPHGDDSKTVRQRVSAARARQFQRNGQGIVNAHLQGPELDRHAALNHECKELLLQASRTLGFSARAFHRILRVGRTIADLEESADLQLTHLAEAIQYRVGGRFLSQ